MLSLDLFNTVYERALNEGAVDDLEARHIHGLNTKMLELMGRAKGAKPEMKAALMREYAKIKDERDSYFKIRTSSTNEAGLPDIADKQAKMARLNQPGKVGSDVVTPQQRVNPNPNKGIIGHAKDWLTGKGGPGKEGPTYEEELDEQEEDLYKDLGVGYGVYKEILNAWNDKKPYTIVPMPGGGNLSITRNQIFNVLLALKNMKDNEFKKTLSSSFANLDKFMVWSNGIKRYQLPPEKPEPAPGGIAPGGKEMTQTNLPLKERSSQKKNSKNVDTPQSTAVQRYLTKVRRAAPNATSDIEAVAKHDLEQQARTDKTINDLKAVNTRQDQALKQAMSLDMQQGNELNDVESQLDQLSQKLQLIKTAKPTVNQPVASTSVASTTKSSKSDTTKVTQPNREPAEIPPPIYIDEPGNLSLKDQEIYTKVKDLETELKSKIDAMASWNKVAQKDDEARNELDILRKDMERTKRELNHKIKQLKKSGAVSAEPRQAGLDMAPARQRVNPAAALRQNLGQTLGRVPARELPVPNEPELNILSQADFNRLSSNLERQPVEVEEGQMSELDAMRQDLELMTDRQFSIAYGMSKEAFKQQYRTLLNPAPQQSTPVIDEHGGGIGPKQRWQDLMQERKLNVGDPVVVTAPNEFEGKTGEIYEFSPSGKFVVVNLYNHGKHSMHLSDVEFNQYAADQDEDNWYDEEVAEGWQDFNKVEPYAVCLAGKPVKKFDYYEDARRFHDNWKKKLYREGNQAKADKITLMPLNLDEATGDSKFDAMMGKISNDPWTQLNSDPNWEYEIEELVSKHIEPWLSAMEKANIPITKDEDTLNPSWRKRYEQVSTQLAQKFLTSKKFNPRDPDLVNKIRAYIDWYTNESNSVHGQLDAYATDLPLQLYLDTPVADEKIADLRAAMYPNAQDEVDDDGYATRPRPEADPRRLDPGNMEETKADPAGSWVVYNGSKVKRFKTHGGAKAYAEKNGGKVYSSEFYADKIQKQVDENSAPTQQQWMQTIKQQHPNVNFAQNKTTMQIFAMVPGKGKVSTFDPRQPVNELEVADLVRPDTQTNAPPRRAYSIALQGKPGRDFNAEYAWDALQSVFPREYPVDSEAAEQKVIEVHKRGSAIVKTGINSEDIADSYVAKLAAKRVPAQFWKIIGGELEEAETDYSKRRQRERDVDAGKPVPKQRQPKITDYQKRRAEQKRQEQLGEEQDTSGVERAILNRIMVVHTDLLMKFGPEKVMQAAEEVAYNVGDVDEIGTSDVSAWVHQVKQILGVPEELDEKWSQKYKSSINCANPKGFSQRAHCAGKKK